MKLPALATVYLDNEPVHLMGDPRPPVIKVLAASGRRSGVVRVIRTESPTDTKGIPVHLDDLIDRTAQPTRPIYLRSQAGPPPAEVEFPSSTNPGPLPLGTPLPGESLEEAPLPPASPAPLPHQPSHPDGGDKA